MPYQIADTGHLHKDQLQKLLQISNNIGNEALFIRTQQATELEKAGIPILLLSYSNNKLLAGISAFGNEFYNFNATFLK